MQPRPLLNLDEVPLKPQAHGEAFAHRSGRVAARLGAEKLGATLTVVPPGKSAWPRHSHRVNEEMVVVLEGSGTLRFGDEEHPLRAGDVAVFPPGGPEVAHRIDNTSDADLRYLAISTMEEPEVVEYPDSGKFGVVAGSAPGSVRAERSLTFFGRRADSLDYWDGE